MRSAIVFLIFVLLTERPAFGQPPGPESAGVRGDSAATRKRLAVAKQLLIDGKAAEARDAILKAIDEAGDDLILLDGGRYVAARWFAQRLLATLPPEQLNSVRDRLDGAAKKLLDDGASRRDPRPLQELLERYFVSRPAEDAIGLLGEFAFERGEFALAENYWMKLIASAASEDRYPGPIRDAAAIQARVILAVQRQGDAERAWKLFQDFKKAQPDAKGRLAGREGLLIDLVNEELAKPPVKLPELATDRDWPMLGANPARTGQVPGNLKLLPMTPLWTVPIPGRGIDTGSIIPSARSVAFHPVIDGRNIYLTNGESIYRFDSESGKTTAIFNDRTIEPGDVRPWRDADFALMLANGRLYARLGEAAVIPNDSALKLLPSRLICLSLAKTDTERAILHWSRRPPVSEGILAGWEGAPLAIEGRVLAAFSRVEGGRILQAIACYDDRGEKPLWVTDVSELGVGAAENRERHELLTLAGSNVVFASQSGVIAAVNVHSGKPAWSHRYARIVRPPLDGRYRDISPAVASEGRVFVAPNDSDHLFAFDAESGRVLWQDGPLLVDHLIGVAGSKVIAAIAGPQRGLRAYHTVNGSRDEPFGWMQHDDPDLATFGRGLIAGENIAWPTQAGLCLIRLQDGFLAKPLLRGVQGNLAYADGKLIVASPKSLSLFAVPTNSEPPSQMMPLTQRKTEDDKKVPIHAVRALPTVVEDAGLPPILSANPSVTLKATVRRGELFLPPSNHTWAERDGEPTLISSKISCDAVLYRGSDAFLADGPTLIRRSLDNDLPIWSRDLTLPIRTLCMSQSGTLIVRLGEHHLAAIDGTKGQTQWVLDSSKRKALWQFSLDSAPRFDEHFYLDHHHIIVHLNNERCWQIAAATGEILREWECRSGPWTSPPLNQGDSIFIASGPGSVSGYNHSTGRSAWNFERGSPASLAGVAPQLRGSGEFIDLLIHKNHGCELVRLNAQGQSLWKNAPAFLDAATVELADMASDRERLYLSLPGRVIALRAEAGQQLWQTSLPSSSRYSLHALGNAVAAVPRSFTLPSMTRLTVALLRNGTLRVVSAITEPEPSPILILDPESGTVKHRLVGIVGPIISVTVRPSGLWLASPQAIYLVK